MRVNSRLLKVTLLVTAGMIMLADFIAIARDPNAWTDMEIVFSIVRDWWGGEDSLYRAVLAADGEPGLAYYRYPPLWAFAMLPIILGLPLYGGIVVWSIISLAILFGGLWLMIRALEIRLLSWPAVTVLLLFALFGPLYESFYGPTMDLAMMGFIAATYALVERRRPLVAGFAFAAAIIMKIYPVLFFPYFALRREWRLLSWTVIAYTALHLIPMPFIGVRDTIDYYSTVLPISGGSSASPENTGFELLLMCWNWLQWFRGGIEPLDPTALSVVWATLLRLLATGSYLAVFLLVSRRGGLRDALTRFLLFGGWVALVMTLIPVSWINYQIFLMFALAGVVLVVSRADRRTLGVAIASVLVFGAYVVMSTPYKELLLPRMVRSDMKRSERTVMTVGYELQGEFAHRVESRERKLASLSGARVPDLTGHGATQLSALGVPGLASTAPDCDTSRWRLREVQASEPTPTRESTLRAAQDRARIACLTNRSVVAFIALRALGGVALALGILVACGTRPTRSRRTGLQGPDPARRVSSSPEAPTRSVGRLR